MTEQRTVERETVIDAMDQELDRPDEIRMDSTKRAPGEPDEMVGGAAIGGVGGAVVGAVVGGPIGAVIGGAIGAAAGTTAGAVDEATKDKDVDVKVVQR
jgi:uncharacterized protein YcfJ